MNCVDVLSRKIRAKHNHDLYNKTFCYVGTNETGLSLTKESLVKNGKENSFGGEICHIGTAGWYNFDIMCITKPNRCIIFDYNSNQITFLKQTIRHIKDGRTRYQFVESMKEYLDANNNIKNNEHMRIIKDYGYNVNSKIYDCLHKSCLLFWPNISDDPSYSNNNNIHCEIMDQIKCELNRKDSWLSTDSNYSYVRDLVIADKIAILCENFTNIVTFKYIVNLLSENSISIITLYLSNISDYISAENKPLYIDTLNLFKYDNPLVIWCTISNSLKQNVSCLNEYLNMSP